MIRILALLTMLLDHVFQLYFPHIEKFNILGRLAFPLFAWGIAKGFKRTQNLRLYAFRLLILAIVSQIPYFLLFESNHLNVCFTLFSGLMILRMYESKLSYLTRWGFIIMLSIFIHIMNFEYGIYGIATLMIFYIFDGKDNIMFLQLAVTMIGIVLYRYFPIQIFSVISSLIVLYFEKYDFKINRLLQYSFYPAHLLLLWIFTLIIPITIK